MTRQKPVRILHVLGMMERGGAEAWLMHILRSVDRDQFRMDFLVHTTQPQDYDDEVRALGSKVIPCLDHKQPWRYARNFKHILREHGPYDVIHSHVHHYSGYVLLLARQAGIPMRIAHSHNDISTCEAAAGLFRRLYLRSMEWSIARYATIGLACGHAAGVSLFGPAWESNSRYRILHCGIDLAPFRCLADPKVVRAALNIPEDAFVIGHVGRFTEPKYHAFLVQIASEVATRESNVRLLLVGDGPLRPLIEEQVAKAGLTPQVIFTGGRSDVPRLMQAAMDVFVLPSLHEGLPVVGIEAQAAGLPFIAADTVTTELVVVPQLVHYHSLTDSAAEWADAILAAGRFTRSATMQREGLALMQQSSFDAQVSRRELERIYVNG